MLFLLAACQSGTSVPEDAIWYAVDVEAVSTTCGLSDAEMSEGYAESFTYAVSFDGSSATLYIDDNIFASGTISGCSLVYQTVTVGQERETGDLKWQIFGESRVNAASGGACTDNGGDWQGTEYFEIVESEDEAIEVGCTYDMTTSGSLTTAP
jgi:hypothetical protein